jgi:RNA polymerase sigma-70 factor (ECF subfamily)
LFIRTEADAGLVARTRRGDVEAFNRLAERWEKRLYNYLLRLLESREDALDACQEAFLKAYQSIGTLADAEKFPQWLFRIAHNQAFSQLRRPSRFNERLQGDEEWEPQGTEWESRTPQLRTLAGPELQLTVAGALEMLTAEQREAVILKVYYGFQFEEIAQISGCPLSTVKSRIYSGFGRLRELLGDGGEPHRMMPRRRVSSGHNG